MKKTIKKGPNKKATVKKTNIKNKAQTKAKKAKVKAVTAKPVKNAPQPKKLKTPALTQDQILNLFEAPTNKLVYSTVLRYANGPLSSVFNEAEMRGVAGDIALEVTRRVMLWQNNKKHKEGVDIKGATAYFSKSFINSTQKIYEKYAKTDIRAGVQTVSSDEALLVAASKHLETPENDWILRSELQRLLGELKSIDEKVNKLAWEQARNENREPRQDELLYSNFIVEKMLLGWEPIDIRSELKMNEQDYALHRRASLELAKERLGFSFNELMEHCSTADDPRIYTREVKKRHRKISQMKISMNHNFYIQTSMDHKNEQAINSLYVRIDVLDSDTIIKDIKPKLIKLDEISSKINNTEEARQKLWAKTKDINFVNEVKAMGQEYVNSVTKVA